MNILYLVNMNENNIKGLFTANHEKIMALKKLIKEDDVLNIYSVQFYDVGIVKLLKKIKKKKIFVNNGPEFEKDGLTYRKEYLKVDLYNRFIEKNDDDYKKYEPFINAHIKEIEECDFVVAQWGYPHGRLAYHIWNRFKKPYFVQYYGSDIHTNPYRNSNVRKKILDVLNNAEMNLFVSDNLRKSANGLGWNGDNWCLTKNCVNFDKFYDIGEEKKSAIRKKLGIEENQIVIGYVGSLTEVKRSDSLVEIYSRLNEKMNTNRKSIDSDDLDMDGSTKSIDIGKKISNLNPKYLFVGDGDMRTMIENDAKNHSLDCVFTGNVDISDVNEYMNIMDIMVLPSRREGFGSVIVEANSLGVLAIGSDAGGIPEVLGNEKYVVSEGDNFEDRYAEKILDFIKKGWNREELISRVREEYDWTKVAAKDLEMMKSKVFGKRKESYNEK